MSANRAARGGRSWLRPAVRGLGAAAVTAALLLIVFPRVTGAAWVDVADHLRLLSGEQVLGLVVVWAAGLYAYTFVLTAALPGLSRAQALTLNLAGSGVSNLVPFGGAVGVGVTYGMARSWGFGRAAFTVFTLITGLWNLIAKLAMPLLALGVLVLSGSLPERRLAVAAGVAASVLALALSGLLLALVRPRAAARASAALGRLAPWWRGLTGSSRGRHWERNLLELRLRAIGLLTQRWRRLSLGMASYAVLQGMLLWLSLRVTGGTLGPAAVLAAFAMDRLLSSIVVTPGGVGFTETGSTALLVAFGGDPVASAAGVLMFRLFTYLIEVPAGAVGGLIWLCRRSWRRAAEPVETAALATGRAA